MSEHQTSPRLRDWLRSPRVLQALAQHRHAILFTLLGLFIALGILIIGFWKTALIALCMYAGSLIGGWRDKNPRVVRRVMQLYNYWILENPFMK